MSWVSFMFILLMKVLNGKRFYYAERHYVFYHLTRFVCLCVCVCVCVCLCVCHHVCEKMAGLSNT